MQKPGFGIMGKEDSKNEEKELLKLQITRFSDS